MARVVFTANLKRHLDCPPAEVAAGSVREALDAVFADNPKLQSYVLDDQRRLRKHVMVFVDSSPLKDEVALNDAVGENSEIYVMQALSGG